MSEASLATSVPLNPMERPTSPAFSAGASLVPSPVTPTRQPSPSALLVLRLSPSLAAPGLGLNQLLFAKLSVLLLLVRLVYIPLYALDSDAARTTAFVMGAFSIFSIGFGAIFPSTVLTLFGIAAQA